MNQTNDAPPRSESRQREAISSKELDKFKIILPLFVEYRLLHLSEVVGIGRLNNVIGEHNSTIVQAEGIELRSSSADIKAKIFSIIQNSVESGQKEQGLNDFLYLVACTGKKNAVTIDDKQTKRLSKIFDSVFAEFQQINGEKDRIKSLRQEISTAEEIAGDLGKPLVDEEPALVNDTAEIEPDTSNSDLLKLTDFEDQVKLFTDRDPLENCFDSVRQIDQKINDISLCKRRPSLTKLLPNFKTFKNNFDNFTSSRGNIDYNARAKIVAQAEALIKVFSYVNTQLPKTETPELIKIVASIRDLVNSTKTNIFSELEYKNLTHQYTMGLYRALKKHIITDGKMISNMVSPAAVNLEIYDEKHKIVPDYNLIFAKIHELFSLENIKLIKTSDLAQTRSKISEHLDSIYNLPPDLKDKFTQEIVQYTTHLAKLDLINPQQVVLEEPNLKEDNSNKQEVLEKTDPIEANGEDLTLQTKKTLETFNKIRVEYNKRLKESNEAQNETVQATLKPSGLYNPASVLARSIEIVIKQLQERDGLNIAIPHNLTEQITVLFAELPPDLPTDQYKEAFGSLVNKLRRIIFSNPQAEKGIKKFYKPTEGVDLNTPITPEAYFNPTIAEDLSIKAVRGVMQLFEMAPKNKKDQPIAPIYYKFWKDLDQSPIGKEFSKIINITENDLFERLLKKLIEDCVYNDKFERKSYIDRVYTLLRVAVSYLDKKPDVKEAEKLIDEILLGNNFSFYDYIMQVRETHLRLKK